MNSEPTYVAFCDARRVADGALRDVLPVLQRRHARNPAELVLVFEVETGRQVDFDLRRSPEAVADAAAPEAARGPGRPRLGVVSREVSLLPRHWDWLDRQPNGISAALRRLVEQAIKTEPGRERARRIRAALSPVLTALAGDRPHYEEACRALFAGDAARFGALVARWPRDVRAFAERQMAAAAEAERASAAPAPRDPDPTSGDEAGEGHDGGGRPARHSRATAEVRR